MKKLILLFLLAALCAIAQPTAQIWYTISPSPAAGSSCTGLFPGIAGLITSTGPMTCQNGVWVLAPNSPVAGSQIAAGAVGGTQLQSTTAVGSSALQVCHGFYDFTTDGGAVGLITPVNTCTIPANAIIYSQILDYTTALTSGGSATLSVGTTGTGGGAAILQSATAYASLTGIVQGVIVPQTASGFKKLTTAGVVTVTVATAALTAGHLEFWVMWVQSPT